MFDTFTDRARQVITLAVKEAERFQRSYVGTEHLLLGLAKEGNGIARTALNECGVTYDKICQELAMGLPPPRDARNSDGMLPFNPPAKTIIEQSINEATKLGHPFAGTEHLLLAMLHHKDNFGVTLLARCASTEAAVEESIMRFLGFVDRDASGDPAQHPGIPDYVAVVKAMAHLVLTAYEEGKGCDTWHYSPTACAEYERLEKLSGIEFPKPPEDL
jgi:ATP-dependent Clp protease ATP-binding subunit ClpC